MSYPFFIATLPHLLPAEPPAVTVAWFLERAQANLRDPDWDLLTALVEDRPHRHGLVQAWRRHETQLRNAVARHRAARAETDPAPWLREHEGYDVSLERGVAQAFQAADPLQRERLLDGLRWRRAEELAGYDPFAVDVVLIYFLKLRIAERASQRDADTGRERRRTLLDGLLSAKHTEDGAHAEAGTTRP